MHSSYAANKYADVFKAIIRGFQPTTCVELGVLEGYSTIAIASALKENFQKGGGRGHLAAHDLFENYQFRNSPIERTRHNLEEAEVQDFVTLYQQDAFQAVNDYTDGSIGFLHVDLSNTGATVKRIMEEWDCKMVQGGIICFEGGTSERDQVPWMVKHDAPPIERELETNPIIAEKYVFATYMKFPGLTCLLKKR